MRIFWGGHTNERWKLAEIHSVILHKSPGTVKRHLLKWPNFGESIEKGLKSPSPNFCNISAPFELWTNKKKRASVPVWQNPSRSSAAICLPLPSRSRNLFADQLKVTFVWQKFERSLFLLGHCPMPAVHPGFLLDSGFRGLKALQFQLCTQNFIPISIHYSIIKTHVFYKYPANHSSQNLMNMIAHLFHIA